MFWAIIIPITNVRLRPTIWAFKKAWSQSSFLQNMKKLKLQYYDDAYMEILNVHEKHLVNNGMLNLVQDNFQLISIVMKNRKNLC